MSNSQFTSTLIVPVGFSGSGKTTYYNILQQKYGDIYRISMDDLRIKFNQKKFNTLQEAINDQSSNRTVAMVANKMMWTALKKGYEYIYLDSMNIKIKSTLLKVLSTYKDVVIKIIFFTDSLKPELRRKRVAEDIENGEVRADTTEIISDEEINLFNKACNELLNLSPNKNVEFYKRTKVKNKYRTVRINSSS